MPYVLKINEDANFQKMSQWLGVSYNQLQRVTEIILCINNSEFFQKFLVLIVLRFQMYMKTKLRDLYFYNG